LWKFTPLAKSATATVPIAGYRHFVQAVVGWATSERRRALFYNFFAAPDRSPSPPSVTPFLALFAVRPPDDFSFKGICERLLEVYRFKPRNQRKSSEKISRYETISDGDFEVCSRPSVWLLRSGGGFVEREKHHQRSGWVLDVSIR